MSKDKYQILQKTFGFDNFRPLQEKVVDKILAGEDTLLILPTGGGKSLCYQLPALLMEGVVVVISPLLALMQDQIRGLKSKGVDSVMMSSLQSFEEIIEIENSLQDGSIKIVFVAPERLQNQQFLEFLTTLKIAFFAIDEAHCVSEWGHEFRSDYRQLGMLKTNFPDVGIAAFTATATTQVEKDIVSQLKFRQIDNIIRGSVYRDNLFISAIPRLGNGQQQLLKFLEKHQQEQGIIYTLSRKNTETLSAFLNASGIKSCSYHAGLSSQNRTEAFNKFANDEIEIMVATIAFGMGIDKSNIRFVVHMSLPKTMEAYYQEMGRAGRDGLASDVLLLYATSDLGKLGSFIADIEDESYKDLAYNKLNLIKKYAFSENCRHKSLSKYFDDKMQNCETNCDNCLNPDTERSDISEQAKMFLSAVYRTKQSFGQTHIIDVLLGSKNQKVLSRSHQDLSVYGIGIKTNKGLWRIIADRLLEIDALIIGEFKELKLTNFATKILKSEQSVDIRKSSMQSQSMVAENAIKSKYTVDENIFKQLKELRMEIAAEENMPAYIIFDNKTLTEMAYFLPTNVEKLLEINGVGSVKIDKYGERFLQLLTQIKGDDFIEKTPTITTAKKTHKTYQATLDLINENLSIEEISQIRNLAFTTILGHINKLTDDGELTDTIKQQLFSTVPVNEKVDKWIKQGLVSVGSVEEMQQYLSIFKQLNHNN